MQSGCTAPSLFRVRRFHAFPGLRGQNEAARQLRVWLAQHPSSPLFVSVKLSTKQLMDSVLLRTPQNVLRDGRLDPGRLKLEVAESAIMEDPGTLAAELHRLKLLGVPLMMDDFGSGHSSLSRRNEFPIDAVKIDRAFVANMSRNRQRAAIIPPYSRWHAISTWKWSPRASRTPRN